MLWRKLGCIQDENGDLVKESTMLNVSHNQKHVSPLPIRENNASGALQPLH